MLEEGPAPVTQARRPPLWLLPNLLSLDAPLVAVSWLWMFHRTLRVDYHPAAAYVVLGLSVWSIYIFDRLLDASMFSHSPELLEERHKFHLRYRFWFAIAGAAAGIGALVLALLSMPMAVLTYALVGGGLVLAFFALALFSSPRSGEVNYLKNLVAGLTFAYGTAVAAFVYLPSEGIVDLLTSREVRCFSLLCVLNISAIDLWERSSRTHDQEQKASNMLALTLPLTVLGGVALWFALQAGREVMALGEMPADGRDPAVITRAFYYGVLVSTGLLLILNHKREEYSMACLRVLADVALLAGVVAYAALAS